MGNQSERRTSKRLAATNDYEQDDDFTFFRKSKRTKTEEPEQPTTKSGRGRQAKNHAVKELVAIPQEEDEEEERVEQVRPPPATKSTARKSSRQKQQVDEVAKDVAPPARSKPTGRGGRKAAQLPPVGDEEPEAVAPNSASTRGRGTRKPTARLPPSDDDKMEVVPTNSASRARGGKKTGPVRTAKAQPDSPLPQETSVESAKIALPMSDTPIINRNKEMRKKGTGNRRSSLGSRGRRASSLIESGQAAIPHREVNPAEFYKHIEAEGLTEPRRMKQLLTWCGERALSEKPPHGSKNASIIHGARAIQDQLLKDFGSRSEFSDWFSRDDAPKAPVILKPNPRNIELDEKIAQLEENVKRLHEEKKAWQAIRKPPPEPAPLFTEDDLKAGTISLPDFDLLDASDGPIRGFLADESTSLNIVRGQTEKRLRGIRSTLEFEMDQLADNMHKLEQRVLVADEEADKVLSLSALRLKEREDRERTDAGTKNMPIMEVLRSLGNILPESGG